MTEPWMECPKCGAWQTKHNDPCVKCGALNKDLTVRTDDGELDLDGVHERVIKAKGLPWYH